MTIAIHHLFKIEKNVKIKKIMISGRTIYSALMDNIVETIINLNVSSTQNQIPISYQYQTNLKKISKR